MRMEDLDAPRVMAGAADDILRTLERLGLHSDESILYQSQRTAAYNDALDILQQSRVVYPCVCSRKEIADSATHGIEGQIYPGTCRNGVPQHKQARAIRVRTHSRAIGRERTAARLRAARGQTAPRAPVNAPVFGWLEENPLVT